MKSIVYLAIFWGLLLNSLQGWAYSDRLAPKGNQSKLIVADGKLYLLDASGKAPDGRANLLASKVEGIEKLAGIQKFPMKIGAIYPAQYQRYPSCWDIAGEYLFAVYIGREDAGGPNMRFMRIPLERIQNPGQKTSPGKTRGSLQIDDLIPGIGPLMLALTSMAYFPEYFDVIAVDEHHFQVYMSQRTYIRQGEELVLSPQAELLLWYTSDQPTHSFPKPDRVYTIDFEGAFHAIRQQGETYILSEQTGELFLVGEEQLRNVKDAQLPSMATRSEKASPPIFVLDKDRDEFLFYDTEQQQFSSPLPSSQARSFSTEERSAHHRAIENALHAIMKERQIGFQ